MPLHQAVWGLVGARQAFGRGGAAWDSHPPCRHRPEQAAAQPGGADLPRHGEAHDWINFAYHEGAACAHHLGEGVQRLPHPPRPLAQVTYYIQTMESRRRLLFPHLSFESGRHVTKFTSIVDVSTFGPQVRLLASRLSPPSRQCSSGQWFGLHVLYVHRSSAQHFGVDALRFMQEMGKVGQRSPLG
jgi:hypothetical protein